RIRKLLSDGPALLLLTRGGEGATAYLIDGRRIEIHAKPVDVVDTVGAGDTFNAGFLAKSSELGLLDRSALTLAPDDAIKACLTYATKVAAVTVSRAGANPPWARELTN
ncbi:MAG: PfkB family carbohydrate kinase, partial [Pseudomonadota bacterium]